MVNSTNRKVRPRKTKLVPVTKKINGRYYYTKQILNFCCRINSIKNLKNDLIKDRKTQPIQTITQHKLMSHTEKTFKKILQIPTLIEAPTRPCLKLPKTLLVTRHSSTQIDYSQNSLYTEIDTKMFLSRNFQEKMARKYHPGASYNYSVPQMELEDSMYRIPQMVGRMFEKLYKVNVWVYLGDRVSDWHYDGHDNFLYMLKGYKIVYLAHPSKIKPRTMFSLHNNHWQTPQEIPGRVTKAVVGPGQCLFIPRGWWHKVLSYGGVNVAVNFWGNSVTDAVADLDTTAKIMVFRSLVFQFLENYLGFWDQGWDQLSQERRETNRLLVFMEKIVREF